jgi:hypothetical protein
MITVRDIVSGLANGILSLDTVLCDTAGNPIMYYSSKDLNKVDMHTKADYDVGSELEARLENAIENMEYEEDFLSECLEDGYTIEDFKEVSNERYEWAKRVAEEHGLI